MFPPTSENEGPFRRLIRKIERQERAGKQVDWGAWAANVSKQEIMDFIEECYSEAELGSDVFNHLIKLKAAVAAFPDERFAHREGVLTGKSSRIRNLVNVGSVSGAFFALTCSCLLTFRGSRCQLIL